MDQDNQNTITAQAASDMPSDQVDINVYRQRLLEDLQLDKLPEEQKKQFEEKIDKLVNDRIVNLILLYLPDESVDEFGNLMEEAEMDKILAFVGGKIPNFSDKILTELMDIREELINGVRAMHQAK